MVTDDETIYGLDWIIKKRGSISRDSLLLCWLEGGNSVIMINNDNPSKWRPNHHSKLDISKKIL
jgi:hypothetical protein